LKSGSMVSGLLTGMQNESNNHFQTKDKTKPEK
jgi:hypothetical protein